MDAHLIKELQHDSKNIRMGLVHFIKQHHGIGARLQQLGQLTPFLVSHVSRRGADELGHLRDDGDSESHSFHFFLSLQKVRSTM